MTGPAPGPARRGRRDPAVAERMAMGDGLEVTIGPDGGPFDEDGEGAEQEGVIVYPGDVLGYSFSIEEQIRGRKVKVFFNHKTQRHEDEAEHDTFYRLVSHVHTRVFEALDDAAARLAAIDEQYAVDQAASTDSTTSGPRLRPTR